MTSLRTKAFVVVAGAGVAAALVATSSPALAATTWTVKAGSAATGKAVAFKASTTGASPQVTLVDTTTNTTLNCTSATAPGSTTTGSGKSGTSIATITGASTTWTSCTGPLGLKFKVTGSGTWAINGTSYKSGVTTGSISGVNAKVVDTGGACTFTAKGTVAGTYTNSTQVLALPGKTSGLTLSGVSGCFGVLNSGDKASFKASYKTVATTSAYNPISITSP